MAVLGRLNWRIERWTLLMPDGRSMSTGVAGRRWDVACAWAPPRGPPPRYGGPGTCIFFFVLPATAHIRTYPSLHYGTQPVYVVQVRKSYGEYCTYLISPFIQNPRILFEFFYSLLRSAN